MTHVQTDVANLEKLKDAIRVAIGEHYGKDFRALGGRELCEALGSCAVVCGSILAGIQGDEERAFWRSQVDVVLAMGAVGK